MVILCALYTVGVFGIVWFVMWLMLAFNTPAAHPCISREEQDFIESSIDSQICNDDSKKVSIIMYCTCATKISVFDRAGQLLGKQY